MTVNCSRKTNMLSVKISRELKKIAEYPAHQLILLGHLDIQIAFSYLRMLLGSYLEVVWLA